MALLMAELPFMQIAFLPPLLPPFDASLITRLGCVPIRHSATHPSASDAAAAAGRGRAVPSSAIEAGAKCQNENSHPRA